MNTKEISDIAHREHDLHGLGPRWRLPLEDLPDPFTTNAKPAPDFGIAQAGIPQLDYFVTS